MTIKSISLNVNLVECVVSVDYLIDCVDYIILIICCVVHVNVFARFHFVALSRAVTPQVNKYISVMMLH